MWADLLHRVRALFQREAAEKELDDELRFHFEQQVEKLIKQGLARDAAERQARLAFGGIESAKEECRDARGTALVESLLQDTRYALRLLRRSPGFAAVVVLSLGLGIGANTAIFSLIDAAMLRLLPVQRPEELLFLGRVQDGPPGFGFTHSQYRTLRDGNAFLTDIAAYAPVRLALSVDGSSEPTAAGQLVSGSYFSVLGVPPVAGRAIGTDDDRTPDAHPVAMLSHGYWTRRFARDPKLIGGTLTLSGRPFTVIGVTPPEFFGTEVGSAPDVFVPLMMQPSVMPAAENLLDNPIVYSTWLKLLGRLRPGVGTPQATAGMDAVFQRAEKPDMSKAPPGEKQRPPERLALLPAATGLSDLRRQFSDSLLILMAVAGAVLLIACANVANLLLARAAARRPEFAMRLALGARRGRLVQQLLVESTLLGLLGGACGLLFAQWAGRLLVAFLASGRNPVHLDLRPDARVLAFTAAVALLTGLLFGLAPARGAGRVDLAGGWKARGPSRGAGPGRALVVFQVALCVVLLFGAALFARSLGALNAQDGGFARDSVLVVRVEPRGSDQRNVPGASERLDRTYRELLERVRALPGVRAASLAGASPTASFGSLGALRLPSGEEARPRRLMVYPGYFDTLGIPLVAGRELDEPDLLAGAPQVAIVNQTFARQAFRGESPLGQRYFAGLAGRQVPYEIVGVVADSRYSSLRGETPAVVYQPFLQTNTGRGQMVLHVRGTGTALASRVRDEVQRIDMDLPAFDVRTLAGEVDAALVRERLVATLSGFFSLLALLLACVGLYGLLAFRVVRRTGEVGVRMALGARRADVQWLVLREGLGLAALGLAIGLPAALGLGRLAASQLSSLLFGLQPTDLATLGLAALAMTAAAALAGYLPARRAARVDPLVALRSE